MRYVKYLEKFRARKFFDRDRIYGRSEIVMSVSLRVLRILYFHVSRAQNGVQFYTSYLRQIFRIQIGLKKTSKYFTQHRHTLCVKILPIASVRMLCVRLLSLFFFFSFSFLFPLLRVLVVYLAAFPFSRFASRTISISIALSGSSPRISVTWSRVGPLTTILLVGLLERLRVSTDLASSTPSSIVRN